MRNYHVWTATDDQVLRDVYPEQGPKVAMQLLGLGYNQVTIRAAKLSLKYKHFCKDAAATWKKLYPPCIETYFRQWTQNSAYLLGYIWADGCLVRDFKTNSWRVTFQCKRSDGELFLSWIRDELKIREGKITVLNSHGYSKGQSLRMHVCSRDLVDDLINLHGLTTNKTKDCLPFPNHIPEDLLWHFLRGYFDGDGIQSYTKRRDRPNPGLAVGFCGQPAFILGCAVTVARLLDVDMPTVERRNDLYARFELRAIESVKKLYRLLYPSDLSDHLYLPRRLHWFKTHLPNETHPTEKGAI